MANPFDNDFNMFIGKNQLTNRKNKFTINYTDPDQIEEEIYRMKQRRFIKNRSQYYNDMSTSEPKVGSIIKIYNINYYVESFNMLNNKHTLINVKNFQRRHFDLQLYSWKYVPSNAIETFTLPQKIVPNVRSNLGFLEPLPPISREKVKIFDIKTPPLSPLRLNDKVDVPNIVKPSNIDTLSLSPPSILPSPILKKTIFDIEAQMFVPDKSPISCKSYEKSSEMSTIIESDLEIEDISDSDKDVNDTSDDEPVVISQFLDNNYFKIENIKNWDTLTKTDSKPLIIVHNNDSAETQVKDMLDDIIEYIESDSEEEKSKEKKEEKPENEGYCTIM